jgi:GTP-binding protein
MDFTRLLKPKEVRHLGTFPSWELCPDANLPEFAFAGRSNVGKSSLINLLLGRKDIARTSAKPGKTQAINLYQVSGRWLLADLPGYGYAKTSRNERIRWQEMMHHYFTNRRNLALVFQLVDASIEPKRADLEFAADLGERQIPMAVVFTKTEKDKPQIIERNKSQFQETMLEEWEELPPMFATSSKSKEGREQLLEFIESTRQSLNGK